MKTQITPEDAEMLRRTVWELFGAIRRGDAREKVAIRLRVEKAFSARRRTLELDMRIEDTEKARREAEKEACAKFSEIREFIDTHEIVKEG